MTIPDSGDMMEYGSIELPCSAEEERKIVRELTDKAEANPREGDSYYVISSRWFLSWQRYTGELFGAYVSGESNTEVQPSMTADRPGSIDNSGIVAIKSDDGKPQLIRTLEESADYTLVPHEVWDRLHRWYGGGPVICRKMISAGDSKQLCVEVFPLCLYIIDSRDKSQTVIHLSKKAALNELYETVCRVKALELEKARIWDYFNEEKNALLAASSQTLEECNLQMDQHILVEVQNDGSWPSGFGMDSTGNGLALVPVEPSRSSLTIAGGPALSNGYTTGSNSNMYEGITLNSAYGGSALSNGYTTGSNSNMNEGINSAFGDMEDGRSSNGYTTGSKSRSVSNRERGGLAGLQNLGNTCFMNSSLQCLVHTPQIAEYFLNDYTNEINKQNPLGTRGELAVAFGELLRKLWSSGRTAVAPRAFKGKLARFAPQFSGYNQHDSQELLAFLLDGLHEDLNRVKQKPYSETKDSDARPDEELANEFWSYHKARNDSVIVDVCQGQYKSTLVCPECNKISITFDPFMYLSLPLPSTATRTMTISVFYADGSGLPIPFTVTVLKHGCCKDLIQSLSSACCLSADEYLLLAEVYEHRIYRYLENPSELLATIKDEEYIVAYRLPKSSSNLTRLEISHRYLEKSILDNLRTGQRKGFLTPLVTFIEDVKSGIDIDQAVGRALAPLKRRVFSPSAAVYNGSRKEEEVSSSSIGITQSVECVDMEEDASVTEMSFHLCTTDDRGLGCKPVLKDTPIERGRSLKVVLDWTDKEKELYDSSFLKDLPEVHKSGLTVKKTKQEAISLFSCLDAFLKEEPLGPDDMWYCPRCKEHRQATKKLDLWRLPDILVFHLKRFSYNRWLKNKLDTFVNFPVRNLDLSKYVKSKEASEGGDHVYELYAISNHYGGLGGGHYSAYCKIIDDEAWYHFDDSHVSRVNEEEIKTSAAYVLFYQRVRNQNQPDGSTTTTGDSLLLSSSQ